MPMTLVVVLNLVMSLLAIGAVGAGLLIARRLHSGPTNEEGRAFWRGPSSRRLRPPLRPPQVIAPSIATATNSSAR